MTEPLHFGALEVRPAERKLWVDGVPHVPGTRAFELLLYLIAHRDRVVPKSELLERVWPGLVVEENNLTVQISALRKLIGQHALTNLSGRGYRFVLEPTPAPAQVSLAIPEKASIAVLPFLYFAGEASNEYLADAFAEDITTELSRFRSLFVISRNSSFTYKGRSVDVRQVSRELGVRYVVEGSVRVSGGHMRITAQLIDAVADAHVWADRYDGSLDDLFDIQDQVVRSICSAVAQGIEAHEYQSLRAHPSNLSAYAAATRAYQIASDAFNRFDRAMREEALQIAETALALDPQCAKALTAKVFSLWQGLFFIAAADRQQHLQQALDAAERLLTLEPATGYQYKGLLLHEAGENSDALACLQRAHQLNPNDVRILGALGFSEIFNDMPEQAVRHLEIALRTSPLDPWAWSPNALLSLAWFARANYAQALRFAEISCGQAPNVVTPRINYAIACVGLGDLASAGQAIERAVLAGPAFVRERLSGASLHFKSHDLRDRYCGFIRIALRHSSPAVAAEWAPLTSGAQP